MKPSIIEPVYKSIIRRVTDLIDELNDTDRFGLITYHNWEERGQEKTLPKNTLIGTDGFAFDENEGLWLIRFSLAVSSYRDMNLLNEIELLDEINRRMGEGETIDLLEMENGEVQNQLVVTTFEVMPMGQSEIRNYRTIGIELKRTGT